jgi:hypothetical protein
LGYSEEAIDDYIERSIEMGMNKQCSLKNGNKHMNSYIPIKYAEMGRILELKNNGVWENGWEVIGVPEQMVSDEFLLVKNMERKTVKRSLK